jgi:Zn-dependent protease with chaperone function
MFALRGIAVSFSVFLFVYCTLSLAVCFTWRRIRARAQYLPVGRIADMLFAVRMVPFAAAALITVAFTIPSFLLLEPRTIDEPLGGFPLVFGICGAALGLFGLVNSAMAVHRASRTISRWTRAAQPYESSIPLPVLRIPRVVPAMTAVGIVHPKILLSGAADFVLAANELQTALNHEIAHVRRRDNLKKLLLRFVAFPGMRALETAWLEATEMAADDAAVSNAGDALDLAAALIKLSRLGPAEPSGDLTAALVQSSGSAMNVRIERLIAWSDDRRIPPPKLSASLALGVALATLAVFALTYSQMLSQVHTATEWLVR